MAQLQESFVCSIRIGRGCGGNPTNTVIGCGAANDAAGFGNNNVAIGKDAGGSNNVCNSVAIGACAGRLSAGTFNTFIGFRAGDSSTCTGSCRNVLIGACTRVTSCTFDSVAIGFCSLQHGGDAHRSIAVGYLAMCSTSAGYNNVAIGRESLKNNGSTNNVAIGYKAGEFTGTSNKQVIIGDRSNRFAGSGYTNRVSVGFYVYENSYKSNEAVLGRYAVTYAGIYTAWTNVSDERDKTDINTLNDNLGINFVRKLRPISYKFDHRKAYVNKCGFEWGQKDGTLKEDKENYGFIAQEVNQATMDLGVKFDGVQLNTTMDEKWEIRNEDFLASIVKSIQDINKEIDKIEEKLI
jgi:hypothetical protein